MEEQIGGNGREKMNGWEEGGNEKGIGIFGAT